MIDFERVAAGGAAGRLRPDGAEPAPPVPSAVQGVLRLVFRARGGATYLAEQYAQAPLGVVRPFPLADGSALLQITHIAPGVMGGDAYTIEITVEAEAKVVVTTTSAAKLHRMPPGASAVQRAAFTVEAGGALEYYPGLVIPFPEAEFTQTLDVALAPGAKFGMLELWAMGRVERGEYLAFRRLSSRTRVFVDGAPCYCDALEMRPQGTSPAGWGILEGHRYVASGYWHWDTAPDAPDIVEADLLVVNGVPPCGHRYLRGLARDGLRLRTALHAFLARHRAAWGLAPVPFERYTAFPS